MSKKTSYVPSGWRIVRPDEYNPRPKNFRVGPAICSVEKAFTTINIHAEPTDEPCPDVETLDAIGEFNARLIVEAPNLLDAAKYAVECLLRLNDELGQIGDNGDQALQALTKAINDSTYTHA